MGAHVLVVDDEPAIVKQLERWLKLQGYIVHMAASGMEALTCLKASRIDVMVTDMRMPGMDGLELIRQAMGIRQELQSIVLTGHGDMRNVIEALNQGAAAYLLKPLNLTELQVQIERSLEKTKMQRKLYRYYESRLATSRLLATALDPMPLLTQLHVILDIIFSVPWFSLWPKGAIFLHNSATAELVLSAHRGFNDGQVAACARVPSGKCLCGKTFASGKIVFDLCQETTPHNRCWEWMQQPHGHYCIPIQTGDHPIMGIITLYVPEHYVSDPDDVSFLEAIATTVVELIERRQLEEKLESKEMQLSALQHKKAFSGIVTNNRQMQDIFQYIKEVAQSDEPVLIIGETGVGKELIAQAIHQFSPHQGELVSLNVAGLDDALFSDTLFGHTKSAFTGADGVRMGLIAKASGGTLFLDEIGDLQVSSQVKLLRLLQDRKYYQLGSDEPKTSRVRIIAATNRHLQKLILEDRFRKDLYFRLCSHQITIPPLRSRPEDIPLLVNHFLDEAARSMGKPTPVAPQELLTLLSVYDFPGNVRELRSMIYNAIAQHKSGHIISVKSFRGVIQGNTALELQQPVHGSAAPESPIAIVGRCPTMKEAEEVVIKAALQQAGGNQSIAATILGMSRSGLNRRLVRTKKTKDLPSEW